MSQSICLLGPISLNFTVSGHTPLILSSLFVHSSQTVWWLRGKMKFISTYPASAGESPSAQSQHCFQSFYPQILTTFACRGPSSPHLSSASSSSILRPTCRLTAASLASSFSFTVYIVCSLILHSWLLLLTAISQQHLCAALPGRFLTSLPSILISTSSSFTACSCCTSTCLMSYLIQDCSVPHKKPQKG